MFKKISFRSDDEIKGAEEKFAESLQLAQMGMFHLLENDVSWSRILFDSITMFWISIKQVEQISQMAYFAEALLDYHSQCTEILRGLVETMQEK